MHDRRKFLRGALAYVGVFFVPLPREIVLVRLRARPEDESVEDVLALDSRIKLRESTGSILGTYVHRVVEWETELDNPLWGFRIRRNGALLLRVPLREQLVVVGDIVSICVRFA